MPPLDTGQKQRYVILKADGTRAAELADFVDREGEHWRIIDVFHNNIHDGKAYTVCVPFVDVANGADAEILVKVGSENIHMVTEASAEGKFVLEVYEGPSVSANGNLVGSHNRYREQASNPDQATALIYESPTIDSYAGEMLQTELLPGGTGPLSVGGEKGRDSEWILARNTDYLIRANNQAGAAKDITIHMDWYEETFADA
jgi:hypothetical protein